MAHPNEGGSQPKGSNSEDPDEAFGPRLKAQPTKSATDVLAEIMLRREAKEEQAKLDAEKRTSDASDRQRKMDEGKLKNTHRRQSLCDHLQGNHASGEAPIRELDNLSLHTYQDNTKRIRCNKCGFHWHPGDTAEFYYRWVAGIKTSAKLTNPTGMGWAEAYKRVIRGKTTGNKPSCGFVTVTVAPVEEPIEV
jgi:hypothetical protein